MAHKEVQTGSLPFLSQAPPPAWAQVVEAASNQGALNMTAQLQGIHNAAPSPVFYSMHGSAPRAALPPAYSRPTPGKKQNAGTPQSDRPTMLSGGNPPKLLKEATAQLKDATKDYPLQSGHEFVFLSLSGILFVGSTAKQRYVLHERLKDLGLAGLPRCCNGDGHLQESPQNTHFLPFRSLSVLPAELLAISVPSTSCAFEEMPVMSFTEWEAYRRRSLKKFHVGMSTSLDACSLRCINFV